MDERFIRTASLLGVDTMERLAQSRVAVFGLGGVGSWCAEALARSGIGELILVDEDCVSLSNCNRQLCALETTLGRPKAEVMAERIRSISPSCRITAIEGRYSAESREKFFAVEMDYIADAIDLVSCKLDLIETAVSRNIPIISSLGTGNKKDASLLRLCDLAKTEGCPFARVIRRELRDRGINHLSVVFSPEAAAESEQRETPPPGRRSIPGSLVWVPASAGLLMAQHIVLQLSLEN